MATEQEVKNWYNERHIRTKEHSWRPFEAYLLILDYFKEFGIKTGQKILDIGYGSGYFLKAAANAGLNTYGVDISEEGMKIAQKTSPNSKLFVGKGEDLKFEDNFFDHVACIGVLEHFMDIEKGIKEMKRVIKPGGTLLILVPNSKFLYWKIMHMKGTEQQDISEALMSLEQWRDKFTKEGLEVLKIDQDNWFLKEPIIFSPLSISVILKAIRKIIYKFIWIFVPKRYTYQFIFILKKNENK